MTRYHFHAKDGSQFRDEEGEELPSLEAAKKAALQVHNAMLPTKADDFLRDKMFSVSVKDETGRLVAVLTTTAVFDPVPKPDAPPELP
jgi:hypothetical protein